MLGGRLAVVREKLGVVDPEELPDVVIQLALDPPRPRRHAGIMPG